MIAELVSLAVPILALLVFIALRQRQRGIRHLRRGMVLRFGNGRTARVTRIEGTTITVDRRIDE